METSIIPKEESTRDSDTDSLKDIPGDIIYSNILTRVPVKSILRFKSVSKDWESSLRSSSFCKMHFSHSQKPHGVIHLLMIVQNAKTCTNHFLSMSCSSDGEEPVTNLLPISTHIEYVISDNINGFSCFHPRNIFFNDSVYICNPSTREITTLPPNPMDWKASYSFGVEPFTSKFKVLSFHTNLFSDPPKYPFERKTTFYIIGSQDCSWRPIEPVLPCCPNDIHLSLIIRKSVCVNGIIHWILGSGRKILTFCLKDEKFGLMTLPKEIILPNAGIGSAELIQIGGCLTVIFGERTSNKQVWILEDYENQKWVKKSIPFSDRRCDIFPYLISSVNTSEVFLRSIRSRAEYFSYYDMRTKAFRSLRLAQLPNYYIINCVTTYAESLLSLRHAQTGSDGGVGVGI